MIQRLCYCRCKSRGDRSSTCTAACRTIEINSRSLTEVETGYSQTEKETFALCGRFHALRLSCGEAHKPLETISLLQTVCPDWKMGAQTPTVQIQSDVHHWKEQRSWLIIQIAEGRQGAREYTGDRSRIICTICSKWEVPCGVHLINNIHISAPAWIS